MSSSLIYFTDRLKDDQDPHSFWLWKEFDERARSGSDVIVYLLREPSESALEDLHSRIQVRSALAKNSIFQIRLFMQSILNSGAESMTLVEPLHARSQLWPLVMAANLRQIGILNFQINSLLFSARIKKTFALQAWLKGCDKICFSHPQFDPRTSSRPSEKLHIDPSVFNDPKQASHWALDHLESLVPGSLSDLVNPQKFMDLAINRLAKDPDHHFVFVKGIGSATEEVKRQFINGPIAKHFVFPENLSGATIGRALFTAKDLLVEHVASESTLAGLAREIISDRHQTLLKESRVYGLL